MWLLYGLLAAACWTASDVANSILLHHFHRSPVIVMWIQSFFDLIILTLIALLFAVQSSWAIPLLIAGMFSYAAFHMFLWVLQRVDVSVMNASWVFLAIYMTAAGFLMFGDQWTVLQTIGSLLITASVFLLSYWHRHVSIVRTMIMLSVLGLLYVPLFLVQKIALLDQQSILSTFFWTMVGAKGVAMLFPLFFAEHRRDVMATIPVLSISGLWFSFIAVLGNLLGFFLMANAYAIGITSLVAMTENAQPFFAMMFAWFAIILLPRIAPKELLSPQSIGVKLISFTGTSIGMVLLTIG